MKHKKLELYKSIVNLKKNPALVFKRTNLSKKELKEFHEDIADILASLEKAHSEIKVPAGKNIPINVGSTINAMIEEVIQGLREKYLNPLRKPSNLKRTLSSHHITVNTSNTQTESSESERPQKLRRFNSDGGKMETNSTPSKLGFMQDTTKKAPFTFTNLSIDTVEAKPLKAQPLQTVSKLKRSKTLESNIGLSSISSNFGFMQDTKSRLSPAKALPQIPDCVQRDITFLQRIQPIFQALDGNSNKENPKENSKPTVRRG
jgi:hypothetical protein